MSYIDRIRISIALNKNFGVLRWLVQPPTCRLSRYIRSTTHEVVDWQSVWRGQVCASVTVTEPNGRCERTKQVFAAAWYHSLNGRCQPPVQVQGRPAGPALELGHGWLALVGRCCVITEYNYFWLIMKHIDPPNNNNNYNKPERTNYAQ